MTEEQFRAALLEQLAPELNRLQPVPDLLHTLRRRQARRNRLTVSLVTGGVLCVAAGVLAVSSLAPFKGSKTAASVSNVKLVSTGTCAGLSVKATNASKQTPVVLSPGTNSVTITFGSALTLQATGPCADTLVFQTVGTVLRSPSPTSGGYFSPQGAAVFGGSRAGTQGIGLVLGCAGRDPRCLDELGPRLATLAVTVVASTSGSARVVPTTG